MENIVRQIDVGIFELVVRGEVKRIVKAEMKVAVEMLLELLKKK